MFLSFMHGGSQWSVNTFRSTEQEHNVKLGSKLWRLNRIFSGEIVSFGLGIFWT